MKNRFNVLFLILIISQYGYSQVYGEAPGPGVGAENNPYSNFQKKTPMMQELFQKIRNGNSEIKYDVGSTIGSPFENEAYQNGKVYYDGEFLGDYYFRFNAYNQEFELKKTLLPEEKMQALIKDPKVTLTTNDASYTYNSMLTQNKKAEEGYLRLFYKGTNYSLYERYFVKFKEGKPAENSMVTAIPSKFSNYTEYYFSSVNNDIISEIPQKQSRFIKTFSKKDIEKVKSYIDSNDIQLSNKETLISIYSLLE
tara:strand:+ start:8913 stop:9671 length:759 start_codon:yes stop_codon:yes gene_type:complete